VRGIAGVNDGFFSPGRLCRICEHTMRLLLILHPRLA
jgi:hypothetical protein